MPQTHEQGALVWRAPTHIRAEHSSDWYWGLGILALCGSVAAVLTGNILFAAIIVLAGIMLAVIGAREPRQYDIEINSQGVVIDNDMHLFRSIHSFLVDDREPLAAPKLVLTTSGLIHPHVSIIVMPPVSAEEVRGYLRHFIKEEHEGHSLSTMCADFLGF